MGAQPSQPYQPYQPKPYQQGIGQTLYQDAASLGQFKALVILILGGIISLVLFLVGVYRLFSGNVYTLKTDAKVTQVTGCMKMQNPNHTWQYDCSTSLEYTVNDKKYQNTINISRGYSIQIGDMIPIYYNPSNPSDIVSEQPPSGGALIALSIFVILIAYLMYWLSYRYTFFAAAQGTSFITNLFKN
jgi:hypothetical protein